MAARMSLGLLLTSAAFVGALAVALVNPTAISAQAPPQTTPPDANELFAKMYPVFTHPRCINCHGVVQSFPGMIRSVTATHPGDAQGSSQDAADCSVCHDESPEIERAWQFTAPDHMSWVGKDVNQLCAMQAAEVRIFNAAAGGRSVSNAGSYLHHLATDPLITQALVNGRAGGAFEGGRPGERPPMTRADFLAAATAWVNAGAPCRATGSISQVESFASNYAFPTPGRNGTTTVRESARRDVQIMRLPDGSAVSDTRMRGQSTIVVQYSQDGCTVKLFSETSWISTTANILPADVTVTAQDGKYEISFSLKPDKTQQTSSGHAEASCPVPNMQSGPDVEDEIEWEGWEFAIRCPASFTSDADNNITCDPMQPQRDGTLSGSMLRTIVGQTDAAERQSWLNISPVGNSRADTGGPLPIKVRTVWDVRLER